MSPPVSATNTFSNGPGDARDADEQVPGRLKRFHRLLDPGVEPADIGGMSVNPVQE